MLRAYSARLETHLPPVPEKRRPLEKLLGCTHAICPQQIPYFLRVGNRLRRNPRQYIQHPRTNDGFQCLY